MSSHTDNTDNKRLKDLLNHDGESKEPLDPFEQEALEGFAMLENKEEALDLKHALDAKIYPEIFTVEKKSPKKYWYAAAGLFLIVGFSIYFFRSSSLVKEDKLAIEAKSANAGDEIQKSIEAETKKNESLELRETPAPGEVQHWSDKEPAAKAVKTISSGKSETRNEAATYDAVSPAPEAAPAVEMPVIRDAQAGSIAITKEDESAHGKLLSSRDEKDITTIHNVFRVKDTLPERVASDSKKKAARERQMDQQEVFMSPPAASSGAAAQPGALTVEDEAALKKELKEQLKSKHLDRSFDVTLKIDASGKVVAVAFNNAFDLTKAEQKEIGDVLQHLKRLRFSNLNKTAVREYALSFRP